MKYVIDASVAFKWSVAESHTAKALRLRDDWRQGLIELLAADLFPSEVANALVVAERRGRLQPGQAATLFADIAKTMPQIVPVLPDLAPAAILIAHKTRASVYDCLYVALADEEQCEMVTADDKLVNNLGPHFPFIRSLASLP